MGGCKNVGKKTHKTKVFDCIWRSDYFYSAHCFCTFGRQFRNFKKPFQEEYSNKERIHTKRRPKREVISGFKMSYRYKYYNQENQEEDEEEL